MDYSKPEATIVGGSEASYKANKDTNSKYVYYNLFLQSQSEHIDDKQNLFLS